MSDTDKVVRPDFSGAQDALIEAERLKEQTNRPIEKQGGPPYNRGMEDRVSKLEGALGGQKQSQTILIASVVGVAAVFITLASIMITFQMRTEDRVETLAQDINRLPAQIATEVREANRAFSDAFSAAVSAVKQPPVIVVSQPDNKK